MEKNPYLLLTANGILATPFFFNTEAEVKA